jgi:hypothetical protein
MHAQRTYGDVIDALQQAWKVSNKADGHFVVRITDIKLPRLQ